MKKMIATKKAKPTMVFTKKKAPTMIFKKKPVSKPAPKKSKSKYA